MQWYDWFFGPAIAFLAFQPMALARAFAFGNETASLTILWLIMMLATTLNAGLIALIFFNILGGIFLISVVLAAFSVFFAAALYEWYYTRQGLEAPWDHFSMLVCCVVCITACWALALPYIGLLYPRWAITA